METILRLRVLTGKRNFRINWDAANDTILVESTKQPVKGKANIEILKELKKFFKADTRIVSGLTSKEKKVSIGLSKEDILSKLEKHE
ncbi:MAG: DUF167 family protein [archaeon]|mgnify:CR=1 FL=1